MKPRMFAPLFQTRSDLSPKADIKCDIGNVRSTSSTKRSELLGAFSPNAASLAYRQQLPLWSKADMCGARGDVRFGPKASVGADGVTIARVGVEKRTVSSTVHHNPSVSDTHR